MDNMENYLQILADSLDKKIAILKSLDKLTQEQKIIIQAEEFDDEAFEKNIDDKGKLIEQLEKLDNGFEILYGNIQKQIENKKDLYKEEIRNLQSKLKIIMDFNMRIQVEEEANRKLIASRFAIMKKETMQVKKNQAAAANYYKTMNNITSEPYFMDSKK